MTARENVQLAPKIVNCPQCGGLVEWTTENRFRPFCSRRCKLIDLGQWAAESYRVPAERRLDAAKGTEPDAAEQ